MKLTGTNVVRKVEGLHTEGNHTNTGVFRRALPLVAFAAVACNSSAGGGSGGYNPDGGSATEATGSTTDSGNTIPNSSLCAQYNDGDPHKRTFIVVNGTADELQTTVPVINNMHTFAFRFDGIIDVVDPASLVHVTIPRFSVVFDKLPGEAWPQYPTKWTPYYETTNQFDNAINNSIGIRLPNANDADVIVESCYTTSSLKTCGFMLNPDGIIKANPNCHATIAATVPFKPVK